MDIIMQCSLMLSASHLVPYTSRPYEEAQKQKSELSKLSQDIETK